MRLTTIKKNLSRKRVFGILGTLFFIVTAFFISRIPLDPKYLSSLGYLGIFIYTFVGTSTIFFPAANLVVIFLGGRTWNPLIVGISGGLGSSFGEFGGYFTGRCSAVVIETKTKKRRSKSSLSSNLKTWLLGVYLWWEKLNKRWVQRYRWFAIFVLAIIPNPLFDAVGLASGVFRLSPLEFFVPTLLGRIGRSIIFAYLGYGFKIT